MSRKRTLVLCIGVFLAILAGWGCSCSNNSPPSIDKLLQQGSDCLTKGDATGVDCARKNFNEVVSRDPKNCGGNWGLILADVQDMGIQLTTVLSLVGSCPAAAAPPLQPKQLDQLIPEMLSPVEGDIKDIYGRTITVEAAGTSCVFSLDTPIPVCTPPYYTIGTDWSVDEARVLGGASHAIEGVFDILLAHSLDLTCVISNGSSLISGGLSFSDLPGLFRKLGPLVATCSAFLTLTDTTRYSAAPWELAHSTNELEPLSDALVAEKGNAKDVIYYNDASGDNALDGGDTIKVGCTKPSGANCFTSPTSPDGTLTIPPGVTSAAFTIAKQFMSDTAHALDGADYPPQHNGITFTLAAVNPLLTAFGLNIALPAAMAVDAGAFFKGPCTPITGILDGSCNYTTGGPKALRDILPYYACTSKYFVAEGEKYTSSTCIGDSSFPSYDTCSDSSHFSGVAESFCKADGTPTGRFTLPADGIPSGPCTTGSCAGSTITPVTLLYTAVQDPSLNGALYVDLYSLPPPYNIGETGPGFTSPTAISITEGNREYNKAFAFLFFTGAVAAAQPSTSGCSSGCTGCTGGCTGGCALFGPRADGSMAVDFLAFLAPVGVILYLKKRKEEKIT